MSLAYHVLHLYKNTQNYNQVGRLKQELHFLHDYDYSHSAQCPLLHVPQSPVWRTTLASLCSSKY